MPEKAKEGGLIQGAAAAGLFGVTAAIMSGAFDTPDESPVRSERDAPRRRMARAANRALRQTITRDFGLDFSETQAVKQFSTPSGIQGRATILGGAEPQKKAAGNGIIKRQTDRN